MGPRGPPSWNLSSPPTPSKSLQGSRVHPGPGSACLSECGFGEGSGRQEREAPTRGGGTGVWEGVRALARKFWRECFTALSWPLQVQLICFPPQGAWEEPGPRGWNVCLLGSQEPEPLRDQGTQLPATGVCISALGSFGGHGRISSLDRGQVTLSFSLLLSNRRGPK